MANQNVIAEYLVSIGFDPDKTSFADLKKQFSALEQVVDSFKNGLNKNGDLEIFQKAIDGVAKAAENAGAAILDVLGPVGVAVGAIGVGVGIVTAGITVFGLKMADADLNAKKFALSLYTTTANARSLQAVMDAMGVKSLDDLKYVNLIPEQRAQFLALRQIAAQNEPDADAKRGLAAWRQVGYAFQKFQLEASYFFLNVAGRLGQIVGGMIKFFKPISVTLDQMWKAWGDVFGEIGGTISQIYTAFKPFFDLIPFLNPLRELGQFFKVIADIALLIGLIARKLIGGIPGTIGAVGGAIGGAANAAGSILSTGSKDLKEFAEATAKKYNIDPNLLKAIGSIESGFNPKAHSGAGAMGIMQLMPGTAKGLGVTDPYNPYQSISGGAKHIAGLIAKYHGNITLAVAAYNAGGGNVDKYHGIPPFAETQNYVKNVLHRRDMFAAQGLQQTRTKSVSGHVVTNHIAININGASSPQAVGNSVADAIQKYTLRNTQGNFA